MTLLGLFFLTTFVWAQDEVVILEMHRSKPGLRESIVLSSDEKNEYLMTTSNRLNLKTPEFGLYSRPKTQLSQGLKKLRTQSKVLPKGEASPHSWQTKVYSNEDLVTGDQAAAPFLKTMSAELRKKGWRKEDVTRIDQDQMNIIIRRSQKNQKFKVEARKSFLDACRSMYDRKIICESPRGFVFVN